MAVFSFIRLWRFVKVINKIEGKEDSFYILQTLPPFDLFHSVFALVELMFQMYEEYETEIEEREKKINQLDDLNKRLRKFEDA